MNSFINCSSSKNIKKLTKQDEGYKKLEIKLKSKYLNENY